MSIKEKFRRRIWIILGGIGAAAAAVAYYILTLPKPAPPPPEVPPPEVPKPDVFVRRVDEVPRRDPDAAIWGEVDSIQVNMVQQDLVMPYRAEPAVDTIEVKAIHDGEWIAFRLAWSDPSIDDSVVGTPKFRDACAVMLLPADVPDAAWMMGTAEHKATTLLWRSEWQYDIEKGYRDLESEFPNVAVDAYQHVGIEGVADGKPKNSIELAERAPQLFIGRSAGNIFSEFERDSPVEKLLAVGPGTITPLPTQDADGWGRWSGGEWRVVISRRLSPSDAGKGEIALEPGKSYTVAFAVWLGDKGDRGSRKTISKLLSMAVEE